MKYEQTINENGMHTCKVCGGTGWNNDIQCGTCGGTGQIDWITHVMGGIETYICSDPDDMVFDARNI